MRFVIIGATGRTGRRVALLALRRGHEVTAVVRKPTLQNAKNLHVVNRGSVQDRGVRGGLYRSGRGHLLPWTTIWRQSWLVRDATRATLNAMIQPELRRLVIRVAGASILPKVRLGNTMAPCVVIGERAGICLSRLTVCKKIRTVRPSHVRPW